VGFILSIAAALKGLFTNTPIAEGLRPTIWWLFRGSPLYLRLLTLILAILSISLGTVVWVNLSDTNNIVVSALVSPWENAQHAHTGIASFLLSSIVQDLPHEDTASGPDNPIVTSNFTRLIGNIQAQLGNWTISQPTSNTSTTIKVQVIRSPSVGKNEGSQLILSDRYNGFLFVPGVAVTQPKLIHRKVSQVGGDQMQDGGIVSITATEEPRLFDDISMSQGLSSEICGELQKLNRTIPVENTIFLPNALPRDIAPHFSQAYIIFESGVTRLCEVNDDPTWEAQRKYYKPQFTASTLLQDRPYFDETLADNNTVAELPLDQTGIAFSQIFHRTEPYIDLGGNGVVETFCRHMPIRATIKEGPKSKKPAGSNQPTNTLEARYPYVSDAILCLDFKLRRTIENTLLMKIRRFGGFAAEFTCDATTGCTEDPQQSSLHNVPIRYGLLALFYPTLDFDSEDKDRLSEKFRTLAANNQQSQITGRISVDFARTSSGPGPVTFTVPVGNSRLLAGKLDLYRYQQLSSLWTSLFAIIAGAAVIMFVIILADYGLKVREQERAFEAVDTVMGDVPAPYARVDQNGKFLKVNDALAKSLGFESAQTALPVLRNQTYEEYLADDTSRETYQKIKAARMEGKPYRSYTISLWAGGAPGKLPITRFEVHGWAVPTPRISRNKPGQSFGILLPAGAPTVVPIKSLSQSAG
jgi:hypothetical protein